MLKKGERKIGINLPSGSVPYVPAQSTFSVVKDAFAPTLKRMQNEADQTAAANYFNDFQIKTRDQFENFRNQFEFDPEGMKQAVDTYSKTLLDSVPAAYKIQANAMLASYSQNSVMFASSNKRRSDDNKLFADRDTLWKQTNSEAEFGMRNFNEENIDIAIPGINKQFTDGLLKINELGHDDFENMVKTGKLKEKDHLINVQNQTEALIISRGFHIMKTLSNAKDEVQALNWLNNFMNDKDDYDADIPEGIDENNPMVQLARRIYRDDDDRMRIGNEILKKYKAYHREAIYGKSKKPNISISALEEPFNVLHIGEYKGGDKSIDEVLSKIPGLEIGSEKYDKVVRIVNDNNRIQQIVSKTMQDEKTVYDFDSEEDKAKWADAILANNGINKVQYSDLGSDSFQTAVNLFAAQDYFPEQLRNHLKISDANSYTDEGSLESFQRKALMYQYLSNDELFPNVDYDPLYQKAIDLDVLEMIANKDYASATATMKSIANENYDLKLQNITTQFADDNKTFDFMFMANVKTPNAFLKYFQDGKDDMHKHLFAPGDQTTWLSYDVNKIMPPNAKMEMQSMFLEEMAKITTGDNPDIWSSENANLRNRAWNKTMRRMKDTGYGIEINTIDGKPKLVKHPYWHTYGSLDDNDIYAAVKQDFMTTSDKLSKYNTTKWEEVEGHLKRYFDDKNDYVKISVDRNNYKDENGRHSYKLSMHIGDEFIALDDNFKPAGWVNLVDKEVPATNQQVILHTTNEIYKNFDKTWGKLLPENKKHWSKRAIYSIIKNGIKLSDYRMYPDFPGVNDVPAEIRPFAFIARVVGFKGDLREIQSDLRLAAETANNNLSYQKKINANRDLSDTEKVIESLVPPEKTVMTDNAMNIGYKQWALDNYQNTELRLTHRTNNWTAVSSADWDGELDVNYKRDSRHFAVFANPKDSIRAAVRTIINHSALTNSINDVRKDYGSEPTFDQIFKMYAEDNESYLRALEKHTTFDRNDTVNLMNHNSMFKLLKFIVQHEMGREYYIEKFGGNNPYVDATISRGINEAFSSYNGQLGKL